MSRLLEKHKRLYTQLKCNEKGVVMDDLQIIPNFKNYVYDCNKAKIINRHSKKVLKPNKKTKHKVYYRLYSNGLSQQFTLFQILMLIFGNKNLH